MDYKEYLKRIQFDGPLNTTSSTLKKLTDCHLKTVPFEIFDLFGGKRRVLSLEKIYNDIVVKKRGGLCYENNGLFCWLLRKLGFEVVMMEARAYIPSQQTFHREFDHMFMMVTCIDGDKWIADVGTGFRPYSLPLKFVEMEEQILQSGVFRIRKMDEEKSTYVIEKVPKVVIKGPAKRNDRADRDGWKYVYKFSLTPRKLEDFETMFDFYLDDEFSFMKNNTISCIQKEDGVALTWGPAYCKKKYIDAFTEEMVKVVVTKTEEEFKNLIEKEMGILIDFPLALKADNYTGFTEEETNTSV